MALSLPQSPRVELDVDRDVDPTAPAISLLWELFYIAPNLLGVPPLCPTPLPLLLADCLSV
jgi:hypothetical protein